ncbi:MAG: (Fe-S)-binding protein [Candidatus Dormibacteraeota bacterium]|nr:(Fe-S)-binding protein [Candidatus Dormibacteraeota bacterium]
MAVDIRDPKTFQGPDAPSDDDLATCVHCGLCLNACPTFRVTGLETESPRGRIYLMTQWRRGELPFSEDLARHIDLCLGCRTCEAVCPSGVPYGRIIEHGRAELERIRRPNPKSVVVKQALRQLLGHPRRLRLAGGATRLAQRLRLADIIGPGRQLPRLARAWRPPPGNVAPAIGQRRYRVAFLSGCVMPIFYPQAHEASVRLLQLAGCEVWFPPEQRCCGALHAHNGDLEGARELRRHNAAAFGRESFDYLVVNSAGCGSHLKDFYANLGARVRDLSEFLLEAGLPPPEQPVNVRVTYQDACHLAHAQRIRKQPRELIQGLPGVNLVEMENPDICCGSAGIYNAVQPEMSQRILTEKLDDLLSRDPQVVVTGNPGCQMQIEAGLRERGRSDVRVQHLAELLVAAYPQAPASEPRKDGRRSPRSMMVRLARRGSTDG